MTKKLSCQWWPNHNSYTDNKVTTLSENIWCQGFQQIYSIGIGYAHDIIHSHKHPRWHTDISKYTTYGRGNAVVKRATQLIEVWSTWADDKTMQYPFQDPLLPDMLRDLSEPTWFCYFYFSLDYYFYFYHLMITKCQVHFSPLSSTKIDAFDDENMAFGMLWTRSMESWHQILNDHFKQLQLVQPYHDQITLIQRVVF